MYFENAFVQVSGFRRSGHIITMRVKCTTVLCFSKVQQNICNLNSSHNCDPNNCDCGIKLRYAYLAHPYLLMRSVNECSISKTTQRLQTVRGHHICQMLFPARYMYHAVFRSIRGGFLLLRAHKQKLTAKPCSLLRSCWQVYIDQLTLEWEDYLLAQCCVMMQNLDI